MAKSLCLKCGIYPQSTREKVAKGQCCNKCPNHGPWCTSIDTKHAAFAVAPKASVVSVETNRTVPVIAPQASSATAKTNCATEANHALEYSAKVSNGRKRVAVAGVSKASSETSSSVEKANTSAANQPPHRRRLIEPLQDNSGLLETAPQKLQDDCDVVQLPHRGRLIKSLQENSGLLETAPQELQDDCDVVLAALQDNRNAMLYASPRLRADTKFMLQAVKKDGMLLEYATGEQRLNTTLVLAALKQNILSLEHVPDELWHDRSFVLEALQINTCVLSKVSSGFHEDKEFMLSAVTCNPFAFQHVADYLRKDRDFVLGAIKANPVAITCVADELVTDHPFMLRAIHVDIKVLRYVPELCRDANFMVEALSYTPIAWSYVPEGMLNDHAFMLKVLLQTPRNSRDLVGIRLPAKLKESLDFVLEAIRHDGCLLKYASESMRNNLDVALIAVKQNGMALQYVSTALCTNRLVILEAIAQDANAQKIISRLSELANCSSGSVSKELKRERRQETLRRLSNFPLEVWREVLRHLTVLELFRCASASKRVSQEVKLLEPVALRSFVFRQGMFMGAPGQLYPTTKKQRMPSSSVESLSMAGRNLRVFLRSPNIAPNIHQVNLGLAPVTVVLSVANVLVELPVLEEVVYPICGWGTPQELTNFRKMFCNLKPDVRLQRMDGDAAAARKLRASPAGLMWQGPFAN